MSDTKNLVRVRSGVQSYVEATPAEIGAVALAAVGAPSGVAGLDGTGRIPSGQLPSYVDDVLEFANFSAFPAVGESGKIYIAISPGNICYRWGGTVYAEISPSLALGETSTTAYRGDRGKAAYDHSQASGNPHSTTAAQVGAMPVLDLTGSPSTLDFNSINGGQPCIAAVQWTRDLAICHAPFDQANFGAGTLYQTLVGGWLTQMVIGARWTSTPDTAEGSSVYTRAYVSGSWSVWRGAWSDANLVGTRNEHNHDSVITKSASYDFANITASLIEHATDDVAATLSGGVPGRKYTLICEPGNLNVVVPSGVVLQATTGLWTGPAGFSIGGGRPIMLQCNSAAKWLIPNYQI